MPMLDPSFFQPSTYAGVGAADPMMFGMLGGRFMGLDDAGNQPENDISGMLRRIAFPNGAVPPIGNPSVGGFGTMQPDPSRMEVVQRARSLDAPAASTEGDASLPANASPTSGMLKFAGATGGGEEPGWLERNRNLLISLGAGIAGGSSLNDSVAKGLAGASQGVAADQKYAQTQQAQNMTMQALIAKGMDPAQARAVVSSPEMMKAVIPQLFGLKQTDDITEYQFAKQQGFPGTLEQWMQRKRAGAGEYGMQPIWGTDKDGNPAVLQLGKSGVSIQSQLPEGFKIAKDPIKIDAGTHYNLIDPQTRQVVGTVQKNLRGAEIEKAVGESEGKARAELPSGIIEADQTKKKIDELLSNEGLDSIVGPLDQFRPSWTLGEKGRDALARYNQLRGGAFLQAFGMLRGGGAITEVEGQKAQDAMARMDRAQSEADFRVALKDFRDAVDTGVSKLTARAGVSNNPAPAATPGQTTAAVADPLNIRGR